MSILKQLRSEVVARKLILTSDKVKVIVFCFVMTIISVVIGNLITIKFFSEVMNVAR